MSECQTINIGENRSPHIKNKNRSPTCTRDKIPKHLLKNMDIYQLILLL